MKSILLTFDVEDWHPLADEWVHGFRTVPSGRVPKQVDEIRRVLDSLGAQGTFFCVGSTARAYPAMIRSLAADGHEIASHGYAHNPVYRLSPIEFEADLKRAHEVLSHLIGRAPVGFRAPQFSINSATWWAFDILVKYGYLYDSSIFPVRHRRYGVPGFDRFPKGIKAGGGSIVELPLATAQFCGLNLPIAGGGYFRFTPKWALTRLVNSIASVCLPLRPIFIHMNSTPIRYSLLYGHLQLGLQSRLEGLPPFKISDGTRSPVRSWQSPAGPKSSLVASLSARLPRVAGSIGGKRSTPRSTLDESDSGETA